MGAQIDLVIDRSDNAITLSEIKYTDLPFSIDKQYAANLENKIQIFKQKTGTKKQIFLAMICVNGIKQTSYSEKIVDGGIVTADELF
jgi:hypothetical protein